MTKPKRLFSRFPGSCRGCGGLYHEGDPIMWMKNRGATHEDCADLVDW